MNTNVREYTSSTPSGELGFRSQTNKSLGLEVAWYTCLEDYTTTMNDFPGSFLTSLAACPFEEDVTYAGETSLYQLHCLESVPTILRDDTTAQAMHPSRPSDELVQEAESLVMALFDVLSSQDPDRASDLLLRILSGYGPLLGILDADPSDDLETLRTEGLEDHFVAPKVALTVNAKIREVSRGRPFVQWDDISHDE